MLSAHSQIILSVESVTDCGLCDASVDVSIGNNEDVLYEWFDSSGDPIFIENNSMGLSSLNGLCEDLFYLKLTFADSIVHEVFSTSANVIESIEPLDTVICSTQETIFLSDFINIDSFSGQWTFDGMPIANGPFNGEDLSEGLYSYSDVSADCEFHTGFWLEINEPAFPGLSTTYLICEDYVPFFMTDFIADDPDYGGLWYNSDNELMDGYFDPEWMESELFTYEIDSVEACESVFATLFVVKNYYSDPGLDTEILVCEDASSFNLMDALNGTPDLGGQWWDPNIQQVDLLFDPLVQEEGTYFYVVSAAAPCPSQQAELTITFVDAIDAGENGQISVCSTEDPVELFEVLNGIPDDNGVWINSLGEPAESFFDPMTSLSQTLIYEVSAFGCDTETAEVIVEVEQFIDIGNDEVHAVCELANQVLLDSYVPDEALAGGVWYNDAIELTSSTIPISELLDQNFEFVLNSELCLNQTIHLDFTLDHSVSAGENTSHQFCESDESIALNDLLIDNNSDDGIWLYNEVNVLNFDPSENLSGLYVYWVQSENSCPDSESEHFIQIDEEVQVEFETVQELCWIPDNLSIGDLNEPDYSYSWAPEAFLDDPNSANPSFLMSQISDLESSHSYSVDIQNGVCTMNDSIQVIIHDYPNYEFVGDVAICQGESVQIQLESDYEQHWSSTFGVTNLTNETIEISPEESHSYELILINEFGCEQDVVFDLEIYDNPNFTMSVEELEGCSPFYLEAMVDSNENLELSWWVNNNLIEDENQISYYIDVPGIYELEVQASNENNCQVVQTLDSFIQVYQKPNASFEIPENINQIQSQFILVNSSEFNDQNFWYQEGALFSEETNPTIFLEENSDLNVELCLEVMSEFGCVDQTCQMLEIEPQLQVHVPNSFTPDNDGVNDLFKPILWGTDPLDYIFSVYDRWDNKVFETKDMNEAWDGHGPSDYSYFAQNDVYIWTLEYRKNKLADKKQLTGFVTILR